MADISKNFPDGLSYRIPFDMTTYISESIHEVYKTLFEALALVIFVVFLSLQSWRATLIPLIAVPISLIGTFDSCSYSDSRSISSPCSAWYSP